MKNKIIGSRKATDVAIASDCPFDFRQQSILWLEVSPSAVMY